MIFIVTHTTDYTVDFLANILNKKNLPFLRLNTDKLHTYQIELSLNEEFSISIEGITSFTSVWFRRVQYVDLPSIEEPILTHLRADYECLLLNLLTVCPFERLLSHPYQIYLAENKLYQLRKAVEVGFTIPKTLVTNSKDSLDSFLEAQPSIIKPIRSATLSDHSGRSHLFTSNIEKDDLNGKDLTPCIFQNRIEKDFEVRVTVVHNTVFAFKIDSQASPKTSLDWRREKVNFSPFQLPTEVGEKCKRMVHIMGLHFGAIDLIVTPTNEYIFLEINPNGQWAWLELETGVLISEAIINYLYYGV